MTAYVLLLQAWVDQMPPSPIPAPTTPSWGPPRRVAWDGLEEAPYGPVDALGLKVNTWLAGSSSWSDEDGAVLVSTCYLGPCIF